MKILVSAALLAATALTATSAQAVPDLAREACHRHHPELHCNDRQPACFEAQRRVYNQCITNWRKRFAPEPVFRLDQPRLPPLVLQR